MRYKFSLQIVLMMFAGRLRNILEENKHLNGETIDANIILHILKYSREVLAGVNKMIQCLQSGMKHYFTCIFVFFPGGKVFLQF